MENASKALLMAASVLVALIILSLFIYLVNSIQTFSKNYSDSIETYKNEQFNAQFTAFSTRKNVSIHEIVTLKNFADEFNLSNDVENRHTSDDQYIDVKIKFDKLSNVVNLTDVSTYPTPEYKKNPNKFINDLLDGTYVYNLYGSAVEKNGQYQYDYIYDGSNKKIGKKYYNCYECKVYEVNSYTGRVESITFTFSNNYEELKK